MPVLKSVMVPLFMCTPDVALQVPTSIPKPVSFPSMVKPFKLKWTSLAVMVTPFPVQLRLPVSMYCPGVLMVVPQLVTGVAAYEGCGYTMMESTPKASTAIIIKPISLIAFIIPFVISPSSFVYFLVETNLTNQFLNIFSYNQWPSPPLKTNYKRQISNPKQLKICDLEFPFFFGIIRSCRP